MPTFVHGKNADFEIGGTNLSEVLNEASLPREIETAETTTFGKQDKTYITGLSDATVSLSGMFDATKDAAIGVLITNLKSGSISSASFAYGPAGSAGGKPKFSGNALITSYELSSPVGDVVTFSLELQVTGGVTGDTY
jgi:predicted secreted protein